MLIFSITCTAKVKASDKKQIRDKRKEEKKISSGIANWQNPFVVSKQSLLIDTAMS